MSWRIDDVRGGATPGSDVDFFAPQRLQVEQNPLTRWRWIPGIIQTG